LRTVQPVNASWLFVSRLISDEIRYKLLRLLKANPQMSQREAASELGVSVGKVNYVLQALMSRGWIKASNFRKSQNKLAYRYLLTPRGIEAKTKLTVRFLRAKMDEYEMLKLEIEQIRRDVEDRRVPE
jgi:EPS-associated MarR family transcriptional regulator